MHSALTSNHTGNKHSIDQEFREPGLYTSPWCGRAVEGSGEDSAAQALARCALVPAAVSLLVYGLQPAAAEGEPQVLCPLPHDVSRYHFVIVSS